MCQRPCAGVSVVVRFCFTFTFPGPPARSVPLGVLVSVSQWRFSVISFCLCQHLSPTRGIDRDHSYRSEQRGATGSTISTVGLVVRQLGCTPSCHFGSSVRELACHCPSRLPISGIASREWRRTRAKFASTPDSTNRSHVLVVCSPRT